ncbi:hypothetical protein D3C75_969120 [compost metagenome]
MKGRVALHTMTGYVSKYVRGDEADDEQSGTACSGGTDAGGGEKNSGSHHPAGAGPACQQRGNEYFYDDDYRADRRAYCTPAPEQSH